MVLLVGCAATTPQQADVDAFCNIACACGLGGPELGSGQACVSSCEMQASGTTIPEPCMTCLYAYQHSCAVLDTQCESDCQIQTSQPSGDMP